MPPITAANYDYGLWAESGSSQRGPFGPFYDSSGRVYLIEAVDGNNFGGGYLSCQRANGSASTETWSYIGGFKVVAPLNSAISEHTDVAGTTDGIYVVTLLTNTFGSSRTYGIFFFDYASGAWVDIETSGLFTIPYAPWDGVSSTTPQITTERNIRVHYISTNKLFIFHSASFSSGGNTNRGIFYSIFDLTASGYDILNSNLISPAAGASSINVICETALDTVNSKLLLIYSNTPKDLITGGAPSFSYIGYNYDATIAWSGLIGSGISFNYNASGETSYIKTNPGGTPYASFYASVGVFGTAFAHTIGITRSFFCPYKGNKLHLKMLIINAATGATSQETVFAVDYKVRNSGNPFQVDFNFVPNLAAFSPDGIEVAIVFQEFPSGYLAITRRLSVASWDTDEKFLELVLNEGLVAVNSFQTNRDDFFGVRQFKYWGIVSVGTVNLTIITADTMNMGDIFQKQLSSSGGQINPPIVIDECPDIVASSACAFVKTINDSEDSTTSCNEEVFSESGTPCQGE